MLKNKFLLSVVLIIIFSYFWFSNLIFDIKDAVLIENLLISVDADDAVFSELNVHRISPKKNIDPLLRDTPNKAFYSSEKGYITRIKISLPEGKINSLKNIKIILGNKRFEYSNEAVDNWGKNLKEDKIIEIFLPDEVRSSTSGIKYFSNIINWQGDLKILFKSFLYTLTFFSMIFILLIVIYFILKSALPKAVSADFEKETDDINIKNLIKKYYLKNSGKNIVLKKDLTVTDNIRLFSLLKNNNIYNVLLTVIFFIIIIIGLIQRLILTQLPYLTGDVWGYIGTAVIKYDTKQFVHVAGRSFLYPGFIYLILSIFKDFSYIATVQHILGVVSSALLFLVFNRIIKFFCNNISFILDDLISLAIMTVYISSQPVIVLEHYIVRESIYPILIILQLLFLVLIFINILKKNNKAGMVFLILFFINNFLIFFYQPRWTLTFIFNIIIYIVFLFYINEKLIKKIMQLFLLPLIFSLILLYIPEKILFKAETAAESFLSAHLLFGHAKIADIEIEKDINDPNFIKYDKEVLIQIRKYFKEVFDQKGLKYIGYNVNKLIYGDANRYLKSKLKASDYNRFCKYYFFRSIFRHPSLYLNKVIKEMSLFYNFKGTMYSDRIYGRDDSLWEYSYTRLPSYKSDFMPYLSYKNALFNYKNSVYDIKKIKLPFEKSIYLFLSLTFLISLIIFLAVFIIDIYRYLKKKSDVSEMIFGIVILIFYLFNFLINLTTSMIYSLDVNRYIDDQLMLVLISQFLSFIYIAQFIKKLKN